MKLFENNTKNISYILLLILLAYFVGVSVIIWANPQRFQWDFDIYYHGALAYSQGQNPYLTVFQPQQVALSTNLNYVYPPITLFVFRLFTGFEYELASHIFLILKLIVLIALLFIWSKYFLKNRADSWFYILCLFGFNAALGIDLMAGNISIFEQFFLWAGFYFLMN